MSILERIRIKKEMKRERITDTNSANIFMDSIVDKLDNEQLKRAYLGALKKHNSKNTISTKYILDYFIVKCEIRGIKI